MLNYFKDSVTYHKTKIDELNYQLRKNEQVILQIENRPKEYELSSHLALYSKNNIYVSIYYKVNSMKDILPALEFFETTLGGEFKSRDDEESGSRVFGLVIDSLELTVTLYVSPDEDSPGTCKKILIGENIEYQKVSTKKYEIVCND
jgi:hypothetical protein